MILRNPSVFGIDLINELYGRGDSNAYIFSFKFDSGTIKFDLIFICLSCFIDQWVKVDILPVD